MDERILKWVFDVKIAIDEIELFVENEGKDFLKYKKNLMLKRAVERNLEIIGEAVNRILKQDPEFVGMITNSKAIISLRNQVNMLTIIFRMKIFGQLLPSIFRW